MTTEQSKITELEKDFPAWQVWTVHQFIGGVVWCARLWDNERVVLNEDSPEHLADSMKAKA